MVADEQVRLIALFFLFSLMDEKVALEATHKVVAQLKAAGARGQRGPTVEADLIRVLRKTHDHHRKIAHRNRSPGVSEEAWTTFAETATWAKFQRDVSENELIAVLLSKILGFKEESIADGLGISIGTVRYRVGKAIRALGHVPMQPTDPKRA